MSDRELLELAAKACGLEEAKMRIEFNQWNPIDGDGDALRLAVKLRLDVEYYKNEAGVEGWTDGYIYIKESFGNDPLAATRRAIVRAAAEIGRSMK